MAWCHQANPIDFGMDDSTKSSTRAPGRSVSVVLVSKGRPEVLADTIDSVLRQTLAPRQIIVVVPAAEDLPGREWGSVVQTIVGPLGITAQRNQALEAIPPSINYVAFFDDDFELKTDYLEQAVRFMENCPAAVGLSGLLLADGRVSRQKAREMLAQHAHRSSERGNFQSRGDLHSFHGCNMFMRRALLVDEKFDENLPLYGFAEDYEISMRLERYGKVGKFRYCAGVHLAWGAGRMRDIQYGYSLIANQWYCLKKGTVHAPPLEANIWFWKVVVGRMLLFTLKHLLRRDRECDWPKRMQGHLLALRDILFDRCHPRRILEL
jgi:glycosyltransferase involved in cell wall biosynthesis